MRLFLRCLVGALSITLAIRGQDAPPDGDTPVIAPGDMAVSMPPSPPKGGLDHGTMFGLARRMDTNADLLVEDQELRDGFATFMRDAAAVRADLMRWLDQDGNGSISPGEWRPFYTAMWLLPAIRSIDQNGDLTIEEEECEAAFTRLAEFCRRANSHTLKQFDGDGDGKLSESEVRAARRSLQRFNWRGPGSGPPASKGGGKTGRGQAAGDSAGQTLDGTTPAEGGP